MSLARPLALAAALLAIVGMAVLAYQHGPTPLIEALLILEQWAEQHHATALLIHIAAFTLLATASLPIGTLMCLSAGYLFGLSTGAGIAWLGTMSAAVLTFLLARAMLKPPLTLAWLPTGISRRLHLFVTELEQNAAWYLMLFRIVPIAPFFVVNAAAGVSATLTLRHYTLWSGLGLIPSCLIYAWVGSEVSDLIKLEEALSLRQWLEPQVAIPIAALIALLLLSRVLKARRWCPPAA